MELIEYVFLVVAGILPIANPFSTAPLFISLTARLTHAEQKAQANRACLYMAIILVCVFFLGTFILEFFSITIPAVRVAGGFIIFYIGFGMLFPRDTEDASEGAAAGAAQKDFAFTPLAMPMLSGPGSIAVVIEMSAKVAADAEPIGSLVIASLVVVLGILLTVLICWIVLRSAGGLTKRLGPSGINAMTKILGFILICIGVQFAAGGIEGFIKA